jgi:hypothetical protein
MDCKPKYLLNEILPLMNSKMPKGQPIVDLFKVNPYYYTKWMPPRPQDLKFCNCLIKCFGILIVVANLHVFCPQMRPPNKSIGVDLNSLNQMEQKALHISIWYSTSSDYRMVFHGVEQERRILFYFVHSFELVEFFEILWWISPLVHASVCSVEILFVFFKCNIF